MQTRNPLFADLARVLAGAVGLAAGLRGEVEAQLRQQLERSLARFDLVQREEFEVVRELAVAAREGEERLAARVAALEAEVAALKAGRGEGKPHGGA